MDAPLSVINKVGEVLLLGWDVEIVVSDTVPLAVEQAAKSKDEEEGQADSKTGVANYLQRVKLLIQGICRNL